MFNSVRPAAKYEPAFILFSILLKKFSKFPTNVFEIFIQLYLISLLYFLEITFRFKTCFLNFFQFIINFSLDLLSPF